MDIAIRTGNPCLAIPNIGVNARSNQNWILRGDRMLVTKIQRSMIVRNIYSLVSLVFFYYIKLHPTATGHDTASSYKSTQARFSGIGSVLLAWIAECPLSEDLEMDTGYIYPTASPVDPETAKAFLNLKSDFFRSYKSRSTRPQGHSELYRTLESQGPPNLP